MQCKINLGKENIFLLIFNDGMKDAKQINIFGIFGYKGGMKVKWIILLFLMDGCLRNPHFKIFFRGFNVVSFQIRP